MKLKILMPFPTTSRRLAIGEIIDRADLPAHVDIERLKAIGVIADPAEPAPAPVSVKAKKAD